MFTEYSFWWIIPIILISLGLSLVSYASKGNEDFTLWQKRVLFTLRFLGLGLILFLLLSPVKRQKNKTVEKPLLVVCQDDSQSLMACDKKDFYKGQYLEKLDKVCKNLSQDFNIVRINFSDSARLIDDKELFAKQVKYKGIATDFSNLYSYILNTYSTENLRGIVLASDGINTRGNSPAAWDNSLDCAIYSVLLGDNAERRDLKITNIQHNKLALLQSEYPLEVSIKAVKAKGEKASLFIEQNGQRSLLKTFTIDNEDFYFDVSTTLIAKKVGIEKVSLILSTIDQEKNIQNNRKDIYIEVVDAKKKILLLAAAPHPDVAALKQVINQRDNYLCQEVFTSDMSKIDKGMDYDLIILHNLPDNTLSLNKIQEFNKHQIPLLFILGQGVNVALFNSLKTELYLQPISANTSQVLGVVNNDFSLFNLDDRTKELIKDLPPLLSPSAKYQLSPNAQVMLYQRIGSVVTNYPLIAFSTSGDVRRGFILGENIWRWRVNNYLINKSFNEFDQLITKSLQIVGDKSKQSRFKVEHKDIYAQNEQVLLNAQVYNDNYELVNTPEVGITITHEQKNSTYQFARTSNAYQLLLGLLPEGTYTYHAKTTFNNKPMQANGSFIVSPINMEMNDLQARHEELSLLSQKTKGACVKGEDIEQLEKIIKQAENMQAIIHEDIQNKAFTSLWWYWVLIAGCLASEWFLRKYWGKL